MNEYLDYGGCKSAVAQVQAITRHLKHIGLKVTYEGLKEDPYEGGEK